MKTYNVIAISGGCLYNLVGNLVKRSHFRGYMDPVALTIEVDEEEKEVNYNGQIYEFVEYRCGIHGQAKIVAFKVRGVIVEVYTDTPAHPSTCSEEIRASLKRRKEDPHTGY